MRFCGNNKGRYGLKPFTERKRFMAKVTFLTETCKGCGLCVTVCPKKIIALEGLNSKGYPFAGVKEMDKCIGCASCAFICPDCVITVEK